MATPIGIPGNTAIIPVNTQTVSKTITLPSVQSNPGRVIIIKDNTGNSATNNIFISTTGTDVLDKTYATNTILSTSYGAWIFTNDGVNSWFLVENYLNTLTLQNRNLLAPFPPFSVTLTVVNLIFTSTWTASINATSYSVSYYSNTIPQASGGSLLQTVSVGTALTNTISLPTSFTTYYYAIVTATNSNNFTTTTSNAITAILLPSTPTNLSLAFSTSSLSCSWTPTANTSSYILIFYQTLTQSTINATVYQTITNLIVPFYTLTSTTIDGYYYYITVQAINQFAKSDIAQSSYALSTIYPSAVSQVTISLTGPNAICRWAQQAANATSYIVRFYSNATQITTGGSLIETDTSIDVFQISNTTLINGTYIYATVTSVNQYGSSSTVTSTTAVGPVGNQPIAPIPTMSGNAVVSWPAAANASTYTVIFYQTTTNNPSGGTLFQSATLTAATTLTATPILLNGYYYYATVQANNSYGSSIVEPSINTTVVTANIPQFPTAATITTSGINLLASWSAALNATSYTIVFYQNNSQTTTGGTPFETDTGQTGLTQTSSTILSNGKYYYATITSVNAFGSSIAVTTATSTQQIGIPPLPVTSVSIAVSGTNLLATWSGAINASSYTVVFYQTTTNTPVGGTIFETNTGQAGPTKTSSTLLLNGFFYYVTVQAINAYGSSIILRSSTTTPAITNLPQPTASASISVSGSNLVASWSAALNATYYTVVFYQNATPTTTGGTVFETDLGQTSITQSSISTKLVDYAYYYAIITPFNAYGQASSSTTTATTTPAINIPPLDTIALTVSLVNNSVVATWAAAFNATTYSVYFYQSNNSFPGTGTLFDSYTTSSTTQTSSKLLINGFFYYASVIASNAFGTTSGFVSTNTIGQVLVPPQPVTTPTITQSGTNLVVSWAASLNATAYTIVFYQNATASTTGGTVFETDSNQQVLSQISRTLLLNGYYYYATVQALNLAGSATATITSATTAAVTGIIPSIVTGVSISLSGVNTLVTWSASVNTISYTIRFYQNSIPSSGNGTLVETYTGQVSTSQTSSSILVNQQYYYASVASVNTYGSASPAITPTTTAVVSNAPQPPTNVSITQSGTSVVASWTAALNATSYNVVFYQNAAASTTGGTTFETDNRQPSTSQSSSTLLLNGFYYYATVTSFSSYNSLTSPTITSSATTAAITGIAPSPITSASIVLSGVNTLVTWSAAINATFYTIIFYETTSQGVGAGAVVETDTGQVATTQTSSYLLRNGKYYYASVTSYNIYTNSVAVLTSSTTTAVSNAPQPPTNVTITQSGTSVVASWTAAINATSYNIIFYQNNTATTTGGSTTQIFSYTNATQVWTAPTGVTSISVTMTGGGGGGGSSQPGPGALGGAGGYLSGTLTVTPGTTYTIYVAGGGVGAAGYFGSAGGFGGGGSSAGGGGSCGGGGGGTSYILNGSTLIVAVGGGGGGGYFSFMTGGNGGGQTGGNGGAPYNGTGGTQLAGGTVGLYGAGGIGSYLQGGNAPDYYGGGGGGYYGGGAGLGGGGGSDYSTSLTNITQTQGGGATGGSGALALSNNKGVNGGNGSITILISTKAPFETDNGQTGTSQSSSTLLLNTYYYYATVTSFSSYNSTTSPTITTSSTTSAITGINPSPTATALITLSGVNTLVSWSAAPNATSYTILLYQTATQTVSGGSLVETMSGQVSTSQTTSYILRNGTYYYASVTSVNIYNNSVAVLTSATTTAVSNAPQPPTNITVTFSGSVLSSSWTAAINATSYNVSFYYGTTNTTSGGTFVETDNTSGTTQNLVLASLGGYYYYTTVTTVSSYNSTTSSTITSTNAAQITVAPSAPTNVAVSMSGYYAVCTWTPAINTTTYTVTFYSNSTATTTLGNSFDQTTLLANNTTTKTATTLTPNNTYVYAIVTGVNGYTSTSTTSASTTSLNQFSPTNPSNVTVAVSGINIVVSWTASSFYVTGYTVVLYNNGSTNSTTGGTAIETTTNVTGTSRTTTSTLTNSNYYYATVTATNAIPLSSSTITSSSAVQALLYLQNLSLSISSSTGVATLSWTAISGATYTYVLYAATGNNYTSGAIYAYGTTSSSSLTINTYSAAYYYFTAIATTSGTSTLLVTSSIVQSTYSTPTSPITNAYLVTATNVATMTWSAYTGATGYTWVLIQSTNTNVAGTVLSTGTVSSSTLTASYTGLTLNNYYIFGVYATTASTPSTYGSSMLTLYNNGVPTGGSISLAAFTILSGGSVTITGLAMNATGYIFYISTTTSIANAVYNSTNIITNTYNYTGSDQSLVIPSGTTSVGVTLKGAGGGSAGGLVSGTLTVTPNETLTIIVGGAGIAGNTGSALGTNYGGGGGTGNGYGDSGGGMASIKRGTTMIVVAGAAGGSGYGSATGGVGGGLTGGTGGTFNSPAVGGTGGTQSAGGTGINGGASGGLGIGGAGTSYGGGGGGGYYGGGGGGYIPSPSNADGGGGGGSSYVANLTGTVVNTQGGGSSAGANGQVVITFGSGIATQYTLNQTIAFTTSLSPNTAYYAILVPSNSFGSGTGVVSSSQTTPNVPVGGAIVLNSGLSTSGGTVTITAATNATNYTVYISTTTSYLQSVYNFSTTTTGSAVAFSTTLSGSTTYYAVLLPTNANGNGTYSYSAGVATPSSLYTYTGTLTFTPAGATGQNGPTLSQCTTAYSSFGSWVTNTAYFNMTQAGYQRWTVPATRNYTIVCAGAFSGTTTGSGAILNFTASLTQGHIITIVVGQNGTYGVDACGYNHGSGGGGSFIFNSTTSVLLAAAGGGGGYGSIGFSSGNTTSTAGNSGYGNQTGTYAGNAGVGGSSGGGGGASSATTCGTTQGGGGGGYTGNGVSTGGVSNGGLSYTNGATGGGPPAGTNPQSGGFGGGAGSGQYSGGGGGGYSGGGGGYFNSCTCGQEGGGGGGGSYCYVATTSTGTNAANGYVQIT